MLYLIGASLSGIFGLYINKISLTNTFHCFKKLHYQYKTLTRQANIYLEFTKKKTLCDVLITKYDMTQKISERDQEMPQSYTADQPTAM